MLTNPRDAMLDMNRVTLVALHLLHCNYTELPLVTFSTGRHHTALSYGGRQKHRQLENRTFFRPPCTLRPR